MNVVFRVGKPGGDESVEKEFAPAGCGGGGIAGHRWASLGSAWMRASIYNAVTLEAVSGLVDFMREFQRKQG